jgi:hypothetical protein
LYSQLVRESRGRKEKREGGREGEDRRREGEREGEKRKRRKIIR